MNFFLTVLLACSTIISLPTLADVGKVAVKSILKNENNAASLAKKQISFARGTEFFEKPTRDLINTFSSRHMTGQELSKMGFPAGSRVSVNWAPAKVASVRL